MSRSNDIVNRVGLGGKIKKMEFDTDDEDRIRGCYNSHIEVLRQARKDFGKGRGGGNPFGDLIASVLGSDSGSPSSANSAADYKVLVMEDNVSLSPKLQQETLNKLITFGEQKKGEWDMLHLAYIMYVPGLTVGKTKDDGVVSLTTGLGSALGTTAYVISMRGVDAILDYHDANGYSIAIPDLMAKLFPTSRYAAYPMLFHRASKVKSLVNPQLDSLRELLFEPFFYTKWEALMVGTGLSTNVLFPALVTALIVASIKSGLVTFDAIQQQLTYGYFEGNALLVGVSGLFSLFSLAVLAQGVLLAPPPPKED
ncbi:hypothetical protein TrVE_jg7670 [Triparma verrucosa]|uniref:Uncharacterized protein n=1 Tax=Triparma verrucosa TaxID=1606542 RepID=A0A9W7BZS0_9STRA|nr:hypothetical protein TrVE_jg7670 [Triparma verrucosa]